MNIRCAFMRPKAVLVIGEFYFTIHGVIQPFLLELVLIFRD